MKKLFVCLTIALCLIAIAVARAKTGSADFSAAEAGAQAAQALLDLGARYGGEAPAGDNLNEPLAWFFLPGAYLLTRLRVVVDTPAALAIAGGFGWWAWLTGMRLTWSIVGGAFGLANIAHFHFWLWPALPWRPCYRAWLRLRRWLEQFAYGKRATAHWTGALEAMIMPFRPGDSVFVGRLWIHGLRLFQPIGIRGPRHITVVASSGSGKTRWLKGWLGMLPKKGSAFVVDTDGEMVNALGPALEGDGHPVLNLDPFSLTRFPGACWNALDELTAAAERHGRAAAVRFAQTLADGVIRNDNSHQPVFADTARIFLRGLILYVWVFEPKELRNLIRVRELLTRGMPELVMHPKQDAFDLLLQRMESVVGLDDECDGVISTVIARAASVMKSAKGREGNPFRTTAIAQTAWLDTPEIAAISTKSDFSVADLKTGNACVFICVPVTDIESKLAGWVRALVMMSLYTFENLPGMLKIPCAFCVDEAPSLRIEALETAAPVFRRFGVRLVIITQDIEKLRQAYPRSYGGFSGNSEATIWMGTDHQETLEHLSKILGNTTLKQKVDGDVWSKVPARLENRDHPLMTPDQLREFLDPTRRQIIVTRAGKPPIRVAYEGYDKALPVWRFESDPGYREPILRAATRWVIRWFRAAKPPKGGGSARRPPTRQEA